MTSALVLELVTRPGAGYRDLYYRWEHEQWEAGKIDLSDAPEAWADLDAADRRHLADAVNWRRVRSELATTALVSFVDATPTEEQQVFLTTQLADEARAGVFLDRVADEVLESTGTDMAGRSDSADETVEPGLLRLLRRSLAEAAEALRSAADPPRELVRAVVGYHLGVVGVLGLTELHALIEGPAATAGLEGIATGLAMMQRDSARHLAFALLFLSEEAEESASSEAFAAALIGSVPAALGVLEALSESAPGLGTAEQLQARARDDLAQWLRAVKLRVPAFAT